MELVVNIEASKQRIDKFIAEHMDESRSRIQSFIKGGFVNVNGKAINNPSQKVKENDVINIKVPDVKPRIIEPSDIKLDIVYEDDYLLVINKPVDTVVHPASGHTNDTLVNALLAYGCPLSSIAGEDRQGIVHRLDKDTSGLMLIAKTDEAHVALSDQLKERTLSRKYLALAWGMLPLEGTIDTLLGRHPKNRKKMAVLKEGGKEAITHYKLMKVFHGCISLIECTLETGRTHQIRVHLANIGHSIIGDKTYGRPHKIYVKSVPKNIQKELLEFPYQFLYAYKIGFIHMKTGELMEFEIPMPARLNETIEKLEA